MTLGAQASAMAGPCSVASFGDDDDLLYSTSGGGMTPLSRRRRLAGSTGERAALHGGAVRANRESSPAVRGGRLLRPAHQAARELDASGVAGTQSGSPARLGKVRAGDGFGCGVGSRAEAAICYDREWRPLIRQRRLRRHARGGRTLWLCSSDQAGAVPLPPRLRANQSPAPLARLAVATCAVRAWTRSLFLQQAASPFL